MTLIRTNLNDWSTVDDRCLTHDGVIVDLGCLGWDWSSFFFGKKRVIGVDPFEKNPQAEILRNPVLPFDCYVKMENKGQSSTITSYMDDDCKSELFISYSWKSFCYAFNITSISVLKINIEGGEYPLLHSMDSNDFAAIDQIAVSFHDWNHPEWKNLTRASMELLISEGFTPHQINKEYNWWLFRK